jgi:formylglycine-generating enzyme required for sulfatase activity
VEWVSWNDVQEFISRLNRQEGHSRYRLPTEAEWEYAARAGTTGAYSFGDDPDSLGLYGWYWHNAGEKTHSVGQKGSNPWGLYDMHGNVWEWVQDWYGKGYYSDSTGIDPRGPSSGTARVLRGGSWIDDASGCSAAYRNFFTPGDRSGLHGFRLVLSPE